MLLASVCDIFVIVAQRHLAHLSFLAPDRDVNEEGRAGAFAFED